jgi:hypothetical protein
MNQDDEDAAMLAQQHKDMCEIERATIDALKAARARPLTDDEIMLVAWNAGVSTQVFKEIRK